MIQGEQGILNEIAFEINKTRVCKVEGYFSLIGFVNNN